MLGTSHRYVVGAMLIENPKVDIVMALKNVGAMVFHVGSSVCLDDPRSIE